VRLALLDLPVAGWLAGNNRLDYFLSYLFGAREGVLPDVEQPFELVGQVIDTKMYVVGELAGYY
jgi:hypothetical protein